MEENKDIQCMFEHFQNFLNELRSLGRTYGNIDHIEKTFGSLPRQWKSHVTTLKASKNLDDFSLEELV